MKRTVSYVVLAILIVIGVIFAVAAFRPKEFHFERSITTTGSAADIYALMSDFRRLPEWSPFYKADPAAKIVYGEITQGLGATYSWDSDKMGAGEQTIVAVVPNERIDLKLDFLRPFPATNKAAFIIADDGNQRRVTWTMDGLNEAIFQRAMHMLLDMDGMIGGEFDKGLTDVKNIVERTQ